MSVSAAPAATPGHLASLAGRMLGILRHLDLAMVGALALMTAAGIAVLHGAVNGVPGLHGMDVKQAVFAVPALLALVLATCVDYRWINRAGMALYAANMGALIFVLLSGRSINGARSWIDLGPINWQPSETMKLATAIVCAQWLALHPEKLEKWSSLVVPGLICGIPAFLVLVQPDLGTASLFFLIFLGMTLMAGMPLSRLVAIIGAAALGLAAMIPFLKPYQRARLVTFLNPEADPTGTGYNVIQSKIAVGAGGPLGQGWGDGTQSIHRFLPEHHTDFIFSSAVEQFGLLGGLLLLGGYAWLLWRMIAAMDGARDRFGGLLVAGLIAIFAGHIVLNVGMTMGLLPVTGIPLPLLSYGGTFLVTTFLMFGLVLNVASRRFTFVKM